MGESFLDSTLGSYSEFERGLAQHPHSSTMRGSPNRTYNVHPNAGMNEVCPCPEGASRRSHREMSPRRARQEMMEQSGDVEPLAILNRTYTVRDEDSALGDPSGRTYTLSDPSPTDRTFSIRDPSFTPGRTYSRDTSPASARTYSVRDSSSFRDESRVSSRSGGSPRPATPRSLDRTYNASQDPLEMTAVMEALEPSVCECPGEEGQDQVYDVIQRQENALRQFRMEMENRGQPVALPDLDNRGAERMLEQLRAQWQDAQEHRQLPPGVIPVAEAFRMRQQMVHMPGGAEAQPPPGIIPIAAAAPRIMEQMRQAGRFQAPQPPQLPPGVIPAAEALRIRQQMGLARAERFVGAAHPDVPDAPRQLPPGIIPAAEAYRMREQMRQAAGRYQPQQPPQLPPGVIPAAEALRMRQQMRQLGAAPRQLPPGIIPGAEAMRMRQHAGQMADQGREHMLEQLRAQWEEVQGQRPIRNPLEVVAVRRPGRPRVGSPQHHRGFVEEDAERSLEGAPDICCCRR